jgi:hypothetical protein
MVIPDDYKLVIILTVEKLSQDDSLIRRSLLHSFPSQPRLMALTQQFTIRKL